MAIHHSLSRSSGVPIQLRGDIHVEQLRKRMGKQIITYYHYFSRIYYSIFLEATIHVLFFLPCRTSFELD